MNKVILIGRLTKDVELKYTQSGSAVANVTVAVDRYSKEGDKSADFINVVVWNKSAENLAQYKGKGDQIAVEGSLQTRSYEAQDGSKRYVTEVLASRIEFIGNKSDGGKKATQQAPGSQYGEPVSFSDEDLPF
nr:MAG TPA: Single strand binding protein [Caudoviricetes sp.]